MIESTQSKVRRGNRLLLLAGPLMLIVVMTGFLLLIVPDRREVVSLGPSHDITRSPPRLQKTWELLQEAQSATRIRTAELDSIEQAADASEPRAREKLLPLAEQAVMCVESVRGLVDELESSRDQIRATHENAGRRVIPSSRQIEANVRELEALLDRARRLAIALDRKAWE